MRRLVVLTGVLVCGAAVWGAGASPAQAPAPSAPGQPAPINPANFTGLVTPHATTDIRTLRYEFAGGARTNWHSHAGGQVVFIERGRMRTQERGKSVQEFGPGALVRMPRGLPHGYYNRGSVQARALFWVTPARKLRALFDQLHNLGDPEEVVRRSAAHEVDFLPPGSVPGA